MAADDDATQVPAENDPLEPTAPTEPVAPIAPVAPTAPVAPISPVSAPVPEPVVPTPMPPAIPPATISGAYRVWPADGAGALIGNPKAGTADPSAATAVDIYFGVRSSTTPPPKEQGDLQAAIAQVLTTVQTLYRDASGNPAPQFRLYYTRLFRLAQLGLEGNAMPDIARAVLSQVTDDLINAEGGRVKNAHLSLLGIRAGILSGLFLLLYLAISGLSPVLLRAMWIDPVWGRCFMLLWIGCFGGVWLSYAIRTSTFTLRDLVVTDSDRLLPLTRLIFAGLLTMVLGLALALGFADARIGSESLAAFAHQPAKALLLGLFCGVSEHLLPTMIGKRANDLLSKIQ